MDFESGYSNRKVIHSSNFPCEFDRFILTVSSDFSLRFLGNSCCFAPSTVAICIVS